MPAEPEKYKVASVDPSFLRGKRVMLVMADFFKLHTALIDGLHRLGAEVDFFDERPDNSFITKALIRLSPMLRRRKIHRYYSQILDSTASRSYDYILMIKGECVPVDILERLRRLHPAARMVLYEWDSVWYYRSQFERIRPHFDKVMSFDPYDCREYDMQFLPLFFEAGYDGIASTEADYKYDLLFVGTVHTDRYAFIKNVRRQLSDLGRPAYFYLYMQHRLVYLKKKYLSRTIRGDEPGEFHYTPLNADRLRELYGQSRTILDVSRPKQRGLTLRIFKAIAAGKKLITTNPDIARYDFYDPRNILIVDRTAPVIPAAFLDEPFTPIPAEISSKYTITNFLAALLS